MYTAIDKSISRYVSFTEEEFALYHSLLEYRKVPKKTFLLQEGEVCHFEAYIIKGCIRNYYIDANGFEALSFSLKLKIGGSVILPVLTIRRPVKCILRLWRIASSSFCFRM